MTLDRSYIGYLGFLGIDLFKSVLMYSNGTICLIKLLFKMGGRTGHTDEKFDAVRVDCGINTPSHPHPASGGKGYILISTVLVVETDILLVNRVSPALAFRHHGQSGTAVH